ncbi:hypothetical protein [Blastococcus saxobsidens]|uniref:Putative permease n=1 Tax=Blastococcus saxobsidens (strain DD2) TaxID=1146883 RepID=H6RM74_BLASD|nr:hypothetical protein [Blastococcus saxobsidens]CCG01316.1 putative permease [Blastococcus saxobsidens DD2]
MAHRSSPGPVGQQVPAGHLAARLGRRLERIRPAGWTAGLGLAAIAAYAIVLAAGMTRSTYDVWGALVVGPGLLAVSWPLLAGVLRRERDQWVRRVIVFAFGLKILGALARWAVAFVLYDGAADASRYDLQGAAVAEQLRSGSFVIDLGVPLVGTGFLILLTGIVYTVTGPTLLGGYLVFAWLGFWGLYAFYRAFRTAMPEGNHRRYALLVFLLPSMIFWPSGIGKEAWMCLCLGVATLGAARLLTGTRGAVLPLALGLGGSALVRPHLTALIFVATVAGFLFRRDVRRTVLTPVTRAVTLVALLAAGALIAQQAAAFFDVEDVSAGSVETVLAETERNTGTGGSNFDAQPVRSPLDLPAAVLTVLFRPFPWEAGNLQSLLTSAEGVLLLGLAIASWGRLRTVWAYRAGRPFVVLCLAYTVAFVYVFSTFGNFGILARQRVLAYPFVLALLCLPTLRELRRHRSASRGRPAPREQMLR